MKYKTWDRGSIAKVIYDEMPAYSKNKKANNNSLLGYYAEVKMTNTSVTEAELFQVGLDIFGSSGHK